MTDLDERLTTIEATLLIQKGQIELLLGMLTSTMGRDEVINYLHYVIGSSAYGDSAKISAQEMILHQDKIWPDIPNQ